MSIGGPEVLAKVRDDALILAYEGLGEKKELAGKISKRRGRPPRGMGIMHPGAYRVYRRIEQEAYELAEKWRDKLERAIGEWRCPTCRFDKNDSRSPTCAYCGHDLRKDRVKRGLEVVDRKIRELSDERKRLLEVRENLGESVNC